MKYFLLTFLISQTLSAELSRMFDGSQTGCSKTHGCYKLEFKTLHQSRLISIPFVRNGSLKLFKSRQSPTPYKILAFEEGYWSEQSKHWVLKSNKTVARFTPSKNRIEF